MTQWKHHSYYRKGLSHVQEDTECQDAVGIVETEDVVSAALADGIGSLRYSHIAAQTAVETTLCWLQQVV